MAKDHHGTVTIAPESPIEIAVAMFNGWPTVQDTFEAVQMAIDDFGAIKGFAIKRNDYYMGCDQSGGSSVGATIVANAQNVGVIGPLCSNSTKGAAPVFETAHLVMISPTSTFPDLHLDGPNIFNRVILKDPEAEPWLAMLAGLDSVKQWEAAFKVQYSRAPDTMAKLFYDATTLLLVRINQVSTLDGSGNLVIDRIRLAAAVRSTCNFEGVTGPITLNHQGDRVNTRLVQVWADEFGEPQLRAGWARTEEDPTHWSLAAQPGLLRITTQHENKNWLLRSIPAGDFEIRTRLIFKPLSNYQFAGLMVYKDSQNRLALGRAFCDTPAPACVGNGIYLDRIEGGQFVGSNFSTTMAADDEAYLRLVLKNGTYTGYASTNGTEWTLIGSHAPSFTPTKVGLFAHNQYISNNGPVSEIPADFDDFEQLSNWNLVFVPIIEK